MNRKINFSKFSNQRNLWINYLPFVVYIRHFPEIFLSEPKKISSFSWQLLKLQTVDSLTYLPLHDSLQSIGWNLECCYSVPYTLSCICMKCHSLKTEHTNAFFSLFPIVTNSDLHAYIPFTCKSESVKLTIFTHCMCIIHISTRYTRIMYMCIVDKYRKWSNKPPEAYL